MNRATNAPALSVIIVSYRCPDLLLQCLASIRREGGPDRIEIIVVDNASGDSTVERVSSGHPDVTLIANTDNVGFPAANNQGLAVARAPLFLLLNPDTVVNAGALTALLDFMNQPPVEKIVGMKLTNLDGSLQETAHLTQPTRSAFLKELFRFSGPARAAVESAMLRAATSAQQVGFVSGAALAFNRKVGDRIGNLDPRMFWAEDLDFCFRALHAGIPIYFLPQAEALHYGGESGKRNLRRMIYAQHVSRVNFARKHYGVPTEIATRLALGSILPFKMIARARDLLSESRRDDARQRIAGYRDALKYCLTRIQISAS